MMRNDNYNDIIVFFFSFFSTRDLGGRGRGYIFLGFIDG